MRNKRKRNDHDIHDFQRRVTSYFGLLFTVLIFAASVFILNSVATVYSNLMLEEVIFTTERIETYLRDGNSPNEAAVAGYLNDRNIDFRIINYSTGEINKSNFDDNSPFSDTGYLEIGKENKVKGDPATVTVESYKNGVKYVIARRIMYVGNQRYTIEAAKPAKLNQSYYSNLMFKTAIVDIIGILIVIRLSKYICKFILVPVENISNLAQSISIDDLSKRIPEDESDGDLRGLVVSFNSMIARLETAFKKQNQFVSDASHELKTPIAVINGYINLMDRWGKTKPEIMQEGIDSIKAQTESMSVLIKKLLFLAKYDNIENFINTEIISANEVLKDVMKEFQMLHPERKVIFEGSTDKMFKADYDGMKQLLWIYADNAFKYTSSDNIITFKSYDDGQFVYLSVEDNGKGISQEDISRIFDRFYRVDKSRNRGIGGSGLGLSIAQKMVHSFNGEIMVESEPDVRTAFINRFDIYSDNN